MGIPQSKENKTTTINMKNLKYIFVLAILCLNLTSCTPDSIADNEPPPTEVHATKGGQNELGEDEG